MLMAAVEPDRRRDRGRLRSGWALLTALIASAVTVVLAIDRRHERRRRVHAPGDPADRAPIGRADLDRRPGDHLPRDRRALEAGAAARDARRQRTRRWRAGWPRTPTAWSSGRPTSRRRPARARRASCSARTRTSPRSAGSRRRHGTLMVCSNPDDCAEIERRHSTGDGLLANGGASRGNLLSGDADHVLLTVSRISAEKQANPGYRAFFANGFNVTRAARALLLGGLPRAGPRRCGRRSATSARAGIAAASTPFVRAGVCVVRPRPDRARGASPTCSRGRPAVYATFASYDEVAHHSGLERARHARGAAQARPAVRPHRARAPVRAAARTRSSSSPTTARPRARRSSSATATGSTT